MSRRRRSDYRLSLGWILGVTFIGTLTRLKLPQWSSLSFGAAVCLRLPPHTTSQRKLSRLATDHATCSCLRLTVATNSPRKGLSPPIQCPCRAHQYRCLQLSKWIPEWRGLNIITMPSLDESPGTKRHGFNCCAGVQTAFNAGPHVPECRLQKQSHTTAFSPVVGYCRRTGAIRSGVRCRAP